jgi:hypothetical protein
MTGEWISSPASTTSLLPNCCWSHASLVGGVSGYGTGALMPLVLVPLVGPEPIVPIIAISAMFSNAPAAA